MKGACTRWREKERVSVCGEFTIDVIIINNGNHGGSHEKRASKAARWCAGMCWETSDSTGSAGATAFACCGASGIG